jgi:polysaccharide pyruvyl transferase WcaK-like protein
MRERERKHKKIAFFGHFALTNFGNESTLQAALHNLRRYQPEAHVICITTGPEITARTHKIDAISVSESFVKSWRPRNPLLTLLRRAFVGLPSEVYRWIKCVRTLKHIDMMIIPGTGLLTDAYGLAGWGPYNLTKWSLIAKICRCKLLFISVGAGPINGVLGRCFVRSVLSLADFRSYRDNSTKQYLKSMGFRADDDRIYPDLVFSLPEPPIARHGIGKDGRTEVGIGVMVDSGRYGTSQGNSNVHSRYLETLTIFGKYLLTEGNDVRLLIGDLSDVPTRHEFRNLLRERLSPGDNERIIDEPVFSPDEVLSQIDATDLVVATRFHNVLLALLCGKPVIAISFHHKCDSLMSAMGLSTYCLNINDLDDDTLIEKFRDLKANAPKLKPLIREKVMEFRDSLDEQYRLIFADTRSAQ